ncbi:YbhB/YbcL family Raf kinase inhibitor-like protein [Comamonas aquatica]|uniref:YbhB/YbcL family Raf kinase inhibitor-like protein n=1 Tax=Comamonas aquatica TaxID=225991 RepID=UPI001B371949|nr:YbhB/YbcL family Raf kinase inhibitor-like protein [Comamonas aquatica]QTX20135.1 YbhB/YbcL family Raf kinase inhibitor-like protein [Comamonas aquatica]
MTTFTLSSPDIPTGGTIAPAFESDMFGCGGSNQSPVLQWSGAPAGTQSFAVTVYDPDAPTGSGWWHWMVVDLPASVTALPANAGEKGGANLPAGARQMRNDYGLWAWGGMCPPPGDKPHRYIFTVHALSVAKLDMPDDATTAIGGFMIHAHTLATASFTATYGRPA